MHNQHTSKNIYSYKSILLFVFMLCIIVVGCSSKPKVKRPPVSSIALSKQTNTKYGENVYLEIKSIAKGNSRIKKVEIYCNDSLILKSSSDKNKVTLNKDWLHIGNNLITVKALNSNNLWGTNNRIINIYSDLLPEKYDYRIINIYPHNINDYTQGLEFVGDELYEGTGENGASGIYKKDLKSGKTLQNIHMTNEYFGEGITILNNHLFQVTYKHKQGFVYNLENLEKIDEFNYPYTEGWGLTNNATEIIMSDGTENIYFLDPKTLKEIRRIQVYTNKSKVIYLNELEWINGYIYANIYTTDYIVKIEPSTGRVLQEIDMNGLLNNVKVDSSKRIDVLNGIAYNKKTNKIYVTGKLWPWLFEVEFIKK